MRRAVLLAVLCVGFLNFSATAENSPKPKPANFPGPTSTSYLLPNGWRLTPAGEQVSLTDLPLNILTSADGKYAFVATSGYNAHELTVIDLKSREKVAVQSVPQSWFGLANAADGRLWWSGGGDAVVHSFAFADGKLQAGRTYPPRTAGQPNSAAAAQLEGFRTGIYFDAKNETLFSLTILPKGGNKSFAWGDASTDLAAGGAISRIGLKQRGSI